MRRVALLAVLAVVALTSIAGGAVMALGSWLGPERLGLLGLFDSVPVQVTRGDRRRSVPFHPRQPNGVHVR
jgi:hypothetical protein